MPVKRNGWLRSTTLRLCFRTRGDPASNPNSLQAICKRKTREDRRIKQKIQPRQCSVSQRTRGQCHTTKERNNWARSPPQIEWDGLEMSIHAWKYGIGLLQWSCVSRSTWLSRKLWYQVVIDFLKQNFRLRTWTSRLGTLYAIGKQLLQSLFSWRHRLLQTPDSAEIGFGCWSCSWSADQSKKVSLSVFTSWSLVSRVRFSYAVLRQPADFPHLHWIWCLLSGLYNSLALPLRFPLESLISNRLYQEILRTEVVRRDRSSSPQGSLTNTLCRFR